MSERIERSAAFEDRDVEAVVQDEFRLAVGRYRQQSHPYAVLLAGQPGAGKTELSSMLISEMGGDAAFINGDDYRRYHPQRYQLYQKFGADSVGMLSSFSNAVTERLIAAISSHRLNLIIEGTGRTVEVPKTTAELLVSAGYTVGMAVVAARPQISLISTLLRFYQMEESGTIPRATAINAHDNVVTVLPKNLDILLSLPCISRLSIWDCDLQQLFDSAVDVGLPSDALASYWDRSWSSEEMRRALDDIDILRKKEQRSQLGQGNAIAELARRIEAVRADTHDFSMDRFPCS